MTTMNMRKLKLKTHTIYNHSEENKIFRYELTQDLYVVSYIMLTKDIKEDLNK